MEFHTFFFILFITTYLVNDFVETSNEGLGPGQRHIRRCKNKRRCRDDDEAESSSSSSSSQNGTAVTEVNENVKATCSSSGNAMGTCDVKISSGDTKVPAINPLCDDVCGTIYDYCKNPTQGNDTNGATKNNGNLPTNNVNTNNNPQSLPGNMPVVPSSVLVPSNFCDIIRGQCYEFQNITTAAKTSNGDETEGKTPGGGSKGKGGASKGGGSKGKGGGSKKKGSHGKGR